MSTWIKRRKSSAARSDQNNVRSDSNNVRTSNIRSSSVTRDLRSTSVPATHSQHHQSRGYHSDYETLIRIFNMRQPTNLTGRFPSTVALHAKGKLLLEIYLEIISRGNKKQCAKIY